MSELVETAEYFREVGKAVEKLGHEDIAIDIAVIYALADLLGAIDANEVPPVVALHARTIAVLTR